MGTIAMLVLAWAPAAAFQASAAPFDGSFLLRPGAARVPEEEPSRWIDPEDGWFDLSSFLAQGLGARYLVARKFGLHAGLDVARGPEEGALYVVFGNSWLRP